ncbi:MAG TPA: hypothetical protein VH186_30880 [Chloroflexia bacterium]|nr:hypothetical protein [Chloroflexia bacterium]
MKEVDLSYPRAGAGEIRPAQTAKDITPTERKLSLKTHLLVLGIYILLTLGFAWTILPNLGKYTPGNFPLDRNQYLWSFWWTKHAIFDLGVNPLRTDLLFYPYGVSLSMHAYSPLNVFLSLPLQLLIGTIATYTILGLVAFPLGAYTGFLLAHYLTKNVAASFCAGLLFSFTSFHYGELKDEHLYLTSTWWIPLFVLFMLKGVQANARPAIIRNVLLAGLFVALIGLNDYYYLTYIALFTIGYWAWHTARMLWPALRQRRNWKVSFNPVIALTLKLGGMWLVGGIGLSYILFRLFRDIKSGIFTQVSVSGQELDGSSDFLSLWLPPADNPFLGQRLGVWKNLGLNLTDSGTIGYVGMALAVLALIWSLRQARPWIWACIAWLILALGPSLRFNLQNTHIPLPHRILQEIPLFNIGRYPERYTIMANLSLAIVGAYVLAALFKKLSVSRGKLAFAIAAVACLIYFETWPGFLPVQAQIGPFPFASYISADNGKVDPKLAVLELPVTKHWTSDSYRMLYDMYHARPIIGGYISRKVVDLYRFGPPNPWALYDFMDVRGFEPDIVPPHSQQEWQGLLDYGGFGYVVTYPGEFDNKTQQNQTAKMLEAVFGKGVKPDFEDKTAQVYNVPQGVKLTNPVMVLGWGWYTAEKAANNQMQRWIDLSQKVADAPVKGEAQVLIVNGPDVQIKPSYSLDFQAAPYLKARRLDVLLNGQKLQTLTVQGLQNFHLDGLHLKPGVNVLSLHPDPSEGYAVPAEVNPKEAAGDLRQLTISILNLKLS